MNFNFMLRCTYSFTFKTLYWNTHQHAAPCKWCE